MPFTVHGDIFFVYETPHFLTHGEWDAYGIAAEKGINYYPPFALIFYAIVQLIMQIILPSFEQFTHSLAYMDIKELLESDNLYLSLFLMKLPYIFFDCLLILTCWKMFPEKKNRHIFLVFWAVNPVAIYGTYMFGQFDVIPSFFVVLACYLSLQRGKEHYACFSIAAGCLFKLFPIIFLPIILLISSKNLKDFIWLSLCGIVPVLFFYGILYLISGEAVFRIIHLFLSFTKTSISLKGLALKFFQLLVYILVCYHILFFSKKKLNYAFLVQYFLVIYMAMYWGITHSASLHRFAWILPFLVLYVQQHSTWEKPYYFILLIIFLLGVKSRTSCFGIFAPINPEFFMSLPSAKDVTGFLFDQNTYEITVESLFKGVTALWVISIFRKLYQFPNNSAKAGI
tara:strand:- start:302 stop:1495 length:1194 start_codon:yes stop_codon:yes gene_type:complete